MLVIELLVLLDLKFVSFFYETNPKMVFPRAPNIIKINSAIYLPRSKSQIDIVFLNHFNILRQINYHN